jgi:hypothetical protein
MAAVAAGIPTAQVVRTRICIATLARYPDLPTRLRDQLNAPNLPASYSLDIREWYPNVSFRQASDIFEVIAWLLVPKGYKVQAEPDSCHDDPSCNRFIVHLSFSLLL